VDLAGCSKTSPSWASAGYIHKRKTSKELIGAVNLLQLKTEKL
jgi:hypothetical protein